MASWLDDVVSALKEAGAVVFKTSGNRQVWTWPGTEKRIDLPMLPGRDVGHTRKNYEVKVRREIALYYKQNPGLKERREIEREQKARGMSPKDVERLIPVRHPHSKVLLRTPIEELAALHTEEATLNEDQLHTAPANESDVAIAEPAPAPLDFALPVTPDWVPVAPEWIPKRPDWTELPSKPDVVTEPEPFETVEQEISMAANVNVGTTAKVSRKGKGKIVAPKGETKCPYCQKDTGNPQGLGRHVSTKHPEKYAEYSEKFTKKRSHARRKSDDLMVGLPETPSSPAPARGPIDSRVEGEERFLQIMSEMTALCKEASDITRRLLHDYRQAATDLRNLTEFQESIQSLSLAHSRNAPVDKSKNINKMWGSNFKS